MSGGQRSTAAEEREQRDPGEQLRPLPWFVIMLIGAAAASGIINFSGMPTDVPSQYGQYDHGMIKVSERGV